MPLTNQLEVFDRPVPSLLVLGDAGAYAICSKFNNFDSLSFSDGAVGSVSQSIPIPGAGAHREILKEGFHFFKNQPEPNFS